MFFMSRYLLIFSLLIFFSCKQKRAEDVRINTTLVKPKVKPLSREQWLLKAEKDRSIYGVVELSKDQIVLIRRLSGLEFSVDRGRTWRWIAKDVSGIREFTVDDKGTWWALSYWIGIHEASYCYLYKSLDKGKTWVGYEFNTSVFFPRDIYSDPGRPLGITNYHDDKVYILSGSDPQHNWRPAKQLPDHNKRTDISVENYFINGSNNTLYAKRSNGETDTLTSFPKASQIYQIEKVNNVIYVVGSSFGNDDLYFATIKNEHEIKEYASFPPTSHMKKTQFGHIYLISYEGAYRFKNGKLIHIFK
jgi:hypothetical protein